MKKLIMTASGAAIALSLMSATPALASQSEQETSTTTVQGKPNDPLERKRVKIKIVYKCSGDC